MKKNVGLESAESKYVMQGIKYIKQVECLTYLSLITLSHTVIPCTRWTELSNLDCYSIFTFICSIHCIMFWLPHCTSSSLCTERVRGPLSRCLTHSLLFSVCRECGRVASDSRLIHYTTLPCSLSSLHSQLGQGPAQEILAGS